MRLAGVVVLLVALTSQARADDRDNWRAAFAGSVTLTLGGVMFYWHGANKVSDAESELCARGAYPFDPSCPMTADPTLDVDELDRLNAKGDRGSTIARIGAGMTFVGLALTTFTLYKGFIAKPHKERGVAIAPTVSKNSAGAALTLRW